MSETTVVNISRGEKCDIVIDRRTRWGNQYKTSPEMPREDAIRGHMIDLLSNPILMDDAQREMTGKRLGCHCAPKDCHGNNYKAVCEGYSAILTRLRELGIQISVWSHE